LSNQILRIHLQLHPSVASGSEMAAKPQFTQVRHSPTTLMIESKFPFMLSAVNHNSKPALLQLHISKSGQNYMR